MDRVVSAYTPTLRALKHARKKLDCPLQEKSLKVLIIAKEVSPGYARLRLARDEAYCVERTILDQEVFKEEEVDVEESPVASKVCCQLPDLEIVHFACHAYISSDVSNNGILLDTKLSTEDVSRTKVRASALAYLSACNTALSTASNLLDECITLGSAFQVAGFTKVVGTLWKCEDHTSFEVAKRFYEKMESNTSNSQVALHEAIVSQKLSHAKEPSLWAGYIYSGS
jgi:CHAT domain-containing protein